MCRIEKKSLIFLINNSVCSDCTPKEPFLMEFYVNKANFSKGLLPNSEQSQVKQASLSIFSLYIRLSVIRPFIQFLLVLLKLHATFLNGAYLHWRFTLLKSCLFAYILCIVVGIGINLVEYILRLIYIVLIWCTQQLAGSR